MKLCLQYLENYEQKALLYTLFANVQFGTMIQNKLTNIFIYVLN